jgi:hypothetical protein
MYNVQKLILVSKSRVYFPFLRSFQRFWVTFLNNLYLYDGELIHPAQTLCRVVKPCQLCVTAYLIFHTNVSELRLFHQKPEDAPGAQAYQEGLCSIESVSKLVS